MRGRTKQTATKSNSVAKKSGLNRKPAAKKALQIATKKSSKSDTKAKKTSGRTSQTLPQKYSATTDAAAGIVTLTNGERSIGVEMKSFDAVAMALASIEKSKKFNSSTITVQFIGGKPMGIPVSSFLDLATAVTVFGLSKAVASGAEESVQMQSSVPAVASSGATASAAVPTAATPKDAGRKPPREARKSEDVIPKWFERDFDNEIKADNDGFLMRRARLSIDPARPKNVLGEWKKPSEISAWGYEVVAGKKHVAWVIAEEPKNFVITGAPGLAPSKHRALIGVIARIASTIIPEVRRKG
jgi:hypothetical protein